MLTRFGIIPVSIQHRGLMQLRRFEAPRSSPGASPVSPQWSAPDTAARSTPLR
jgi:hypothetical protein